MIAFPKLVADTPDAVTDLIGGCMPASVLHAEIKAECTKREVLRFRAPLGTALLDNDDRADREYALADLARANKILAAYNPGLIVTTKAVTR